MEGQKEAMIDPDPKQLPKQLRFYIDKYMIGDNVVMYNRDDIMMHTISCTEEIPGGVKYTSKDYLWIRKKK